ncbi:DeoR/GlpR family DNA-binding transcription regulator [Aminobacter sp. J41]|uniref:DeoR/GlpR family DNA-binding transcription regulator n=1 Tax=Aminobacter sp. J41 TaxID=935261 RepID=UPI001FD9EE51|nr:DeoR/GlpR family DNA-binding transcription regulator [Aminobacter sp. J41]
MSKYHIDRVDTVIDVAKIVASWSARASKNGERCVKPKSRQASIVALVERDGEVTVDGLAAEFRVSPETIRRDLATLAENGLLLKVHGGARRIRITAEGSFDERMAEAAAGKAEIARKLAKVIRPGDSFFIDTGSTTLACAHQLAEIQDLTAVTNSVRNAQALARGSGKPRVHLVGGQFDPDNGESVGPDAIEQISRFRLDYAIIGAAAVDISAGVFDADFNEASIARAMCANAQKIIVVAHYDKFGRQAAHRICRLHEIDVLVCDVLIGADEAALIRSTGVTLA